MNLSPGDVSSIIRASVLSDDAREVGGAIDAKLSLAIDRVIRQVETEISSATDSLEDGVMRAVERASGRMQAAGASIEPGLSKELLQEIYRAAREEITSLRQDLQRQIRGLVKTELEALDADRAEPLAIAEVQAIADAAAQSAAAAAVQAHAETLAPPLTEARVRDIVAQLVAESEARAQAKLDAEEEPAPAFGRDDAVAVAREVADAAVSVHAASQPAGLAEDDVHRIVTEFLLTQQPDDVVEPDAAPPARSATSVLAEEWGEGLPEWLQVAIVQAIGNSTGVFAAQPVAGGAAIDPEELNALVQRALEDNPPPSAAFELSEMWRDGLPSWMAAAVQKAASEGGASSSAASSSSSGSGEFDEIAMRQMIIEIVRDQIPLEMPAAGAASAAAESGTAPVAAAVVGIDEQRLRILVRTEIAEMVAELPHPPSEMELSQLIDTAVESALVERQSPAPAPVAADEPAPGETGVFVSKMRTIVEQLLNEKMQDRATHAEVDKVVTRRLEASTTPGAGGSDGLTAADVKRLVREIIEAEIPNREEVEKMIRRSS